MCYIKQTPSDSYYKELHLELTCVTTVMSSLVSYFLILTTEMPLWMIRPFEHQGYNEELM